MFMHLLFALICAHSTVALEINANYYIKNENMKLVDNPKTQKTLGPKLSEIGCAMACLSLESCCIASYTHSTKKCVLDISGSCEYKTEPANGTAVLVKDVSEWVINTKEKSKFTTVLAETSTSVLQTCELGWEKFENHCYRFIIDRKTWYSAQEVCQQNEANLVKIEDSKENEWVKGKANFLMLWIGLNDEAVEGQWRWISDNSEVNFQDWHAAEPGLGDYKSNCVELWNNNGIYKWDDGDCAARMPGYICEKEI